MNLVIVLYYSNCFKICGVMKVPGDIVLYLVFSGLCVNVVLHELVELLFVLVLGYCREFCLGLIPDDIGRTH